MAAEDLMKTAVNAGFQGFVARRKGYEDEAETHFRDATCGLRYKPGSKPVTAGGRTATITSYSPESVSRSTVVK